MLGGGNPAHIPELDDLWRRRAPPMVEARLHALTHNTLALKGVGGEIDALTEQFPGWPRTVSPAH